ncbi:hypothetical protein DDN31_18300 [Vibrio cholerae]|nr:hypothetical protein [Vibrio cholerae]
MVSVVVIEFSGMRCQPLRRALCNSMNFGVYIHLSLVNCAWIVRLAQVVEGIMLSKVQLRLMAPLVRLAIHKGDICR